MQWMDEFKTVCSVLAKTAVQQNNLLRFMPGTYRRDPQESGPLVEERIAIWPVSVAAGLYRVQRVTCCHISAEEKRIYATDNQQWTACYDWASRQLVETAGGKVFIFLPEASQMIVNSVRYFKISDTKQLDF